MTIKIVSTWLKTAYIPEDMLDVRSRYEGIPQEIADKLQKWLEDGKRPGSKQPEESIVVTDEHIIVTTVWFDLAAAQEWLNIGLKNVIPELVSRELIED